MAHVNYLETLQSRQPTTEAYCIGSTSVYENIVWQAGPAIPPKATLDTWHLENLQVSMWRKIQAERDRRKAGGVKVGDHWFHSDDASRIQQLALVIFGANLPANIMWKTMGGAFVPMTPTLIQQIFMTSASQDMTIFGAAEQHKAAMMASADPENYDYMSTLWPNTMYTGPLT